MGEVLVSIVIATYNRCSHLKRCIDALISQETDVSYEIIVVDDGSRDDTLEYLTRAARKNMLLKFVTQKNAGPAAARNNGIRNSRGEIIAFIDDDCIAHADWIDVIARSFKRYPDASAIGGHSISVYKHWMFKRITAFGRKCSRKDAHKVERIEGPRPWTLIATDNCAIRKKVLRQLKGFDEKFGYPAGEDPDLFLRMLYKKHIIYRVHKLQVEHEQRGNLKNFFSRYYLFGFTDVVNYKDHFRKYGWLNIGYETNIFFKSMISFRIKNDFFKTLMLLIALSFFYPLVALAILLIIIGRKYIFEVRNFRTLLSIYAFEMISGPALFIGNIAGSIKNRMIYI